MNKNLPFCFVFYWGSILLFVCSYQWFFLWLVMELSTITFVALFFFEKPMMENVMLYFLVQSTASFFMFFSLLKNEVSLITSLTLNMLLWASIMMKLGVAPFHNWVVAVSVRLKKTMVALILLSQKIIPFVWLMLTKMNMLSLLLFSIINIMMVSPQNMFQSSLKLIIILSSMSHSSWLLVSCMSLNVWEIYFLTYVFMMFFLLMFFMSNMKNIFQKNNRTPLFMILLTLGGIPPLMGFFPKFLVLQEMMMIKSVMAMVSLLIISMVDLFVYTRLGLCGTIIQNYSSKWMKNKTNLKIFFLTNILVLVLLWM